MKRSAGINIIEKAMSLALPICEAQGVTLWDVEFKKEGPDWFLRFFIDKEGGVGIEDCERFSRAIDPVLDEADPIEQSYVLEVSSPGVERVLKKPEHFDRFIGEQVEMKLFKAVDGKKVFKGRLLSFDNGVVAIQLESGENIEVPLADTAYVKLAFSM